MTSQSPVLLTIRMHEEGCVSTHSNSNGCFKYLGATFFLWSRCSGKELKTEQIYALSKAMGLVVGSGDR
jgi:hypothetical protein